VLVLLTAPLSLTANEKSLVHYELGEGLAPYYWQDDNQQYQGIIPDIIAALDGYTLEFSIIARKRLDEALKSGAINFALFHPDYTDADAYLTFVPAHFDQVKLLYERKEPAGQAIALSELRNVKVCARRGYRHPSLDAIAQAQGIERIDGPDNQSLIDMLQRGRCDYLAGSEHVFDYLVNSQNDRNIVKTNIVLAKKPYYFALQKDQIETTKAITSHMDQLLASGQLETIINRHTVDMGKAK